MKKTNFKLTLLFLLVIAAFVGCLKDTDLVENAIDAVNPHNMVVQTDDDVTGFVSEVIPGQYIVVYKKDGNRAATDGLTYEERQDIMKQEVEATLQRYDISKEKINFVYSATIQGFSLKGATEQEIEQLRRDEQVAYIEQDQTVSAVMGGPPGGGGGGGGQNTPWGITRVNGGAGNSPSGSAYIIDTGIDMDHSDLNVDQNNWWSAWSSGPNAGPNDGNGHGSHVAGTVGAVDNSIGVIGVAPGANLIAVKVLDKRGSGSYSGVIAGVDYVGANAGSGDAANMSLGGGYSQAVNDAVIAASGACPFAVAAGNESQHANNSSPASANGNNIYTVASMTSSNGWSSFSNYGQPPVDYIAPGSSIYSTYKDGGYATLSGTSMASPHVCGLLLIGNITSGGTVARVSGDVYTVASH